MEQILTNISAFSQGFVGNITLDLVLKIVVLYFFVFWGALVVWVIKDVTNRTTNVFFQVIAILLVLLFTPIFGLPVYLLIRPRSTIFEQYYENVELESLENEEQTHTCFACDALIEKDFHYCPHCRAELRTECAWCKHLIQKNWALCPYCGADQKKEALAEKKKTPKKKPAELTKEVQDEIQKEMTEELESEVK